METQLRGANQRRSHGMCQRIEFFLTIGPAVKNHNSPKKARTSVGKNQTMCHSLSLVCRRLPLHHPHLLLRHLHRRTLYLTSADTRKIPQPKEVEARVRSYGRTRCIDQPKPKTQVKTKDTRKCRAIYCMNWRTGCNLVDESRPLEPQGNLAPGHRDTSCSSHELPMESRAKVELGSGKHGVFTHFPKKPKLRYLLEDENNEVFLQKTCWYSRAKSGQFWWVDNCGSQNSQWRKWITQQSSTRRCGAGLGHPMDSVVSVQNTKLLRRHKGACKSSWSRIGSLKSLTLTIPWNLASLARNYPGIIVRQHHTDRKQMGLLREQCAEWKKIHLRCCCSLVWVTNDGLILWNVTGFGWAHCIYALPERPKLWYLLEDENYKGFLQKTCWYSRAKSGQFWWVDNCGSQNSQWRKWITQQSSTRRCGAGLGHPMDSVVSVQNTKLLRRHKGACKSSWSRIGSLKSFTRTIPWNLAEHVKIFPGKIVRRHHTDQKQIGLPKEQCVEWKKERLRCCCNQVWMKIGGQIPWNVTAMCETFRIFCLMGNHHMKGGSEYHLRDQLSHLEQWSNVTLFLRKTFRDYINLVQKSCQVYSSVMYWMREESGKETY